MNESNPGANENPSNYYAAPILDPTSTNNSITTDNDITLHSVLTDITTMGEEFLDCGKVSLQSPTASYQTESVCSSDKDFDANAVNIPSVNKTASLATHSYNASAENASFKPLLIILALTLMLPLPLSPFTQTVART